MIWLDGVFVNHDRGQINIDVITLRPHLGGSKEVTAKDDRSIDDLGISYFVPTVVLDLLALH